MERQEFERLLVLFPVVRNRDFCLGDARSSNESSSTKEVASVDVFWGKFRSAAQLKVGSAGAEKFCDAFQKIYHRLVYEELSKETIENFLNSSS
ncbi:hypothetical protein vseg_021657 [Gypsophila vaccaria]